MSETTVDVGKLLDDGGWSAYQKLLVGCIALTIIFDGLDNQLLGAAVPAMMKEWALPRAPFASVLAAALFGMVIGGFTGGYIGDRLGRRPALLGSVAWFGVLTILVSFAGNVTLLTALRFFAGLGLGGAMPNAAALASEYVPLRRRPFAVTLTIVCIPIGGTLAGFTGALVLPAYGWRALFLIGGSLPLVLCALLWTVLPESPRYLARQRARWPELARLLERLGHKFPPGVAFIDSNERAIARATVGSLLVPEYRRDTLALCAAFFFCLLSVYTGTNWVPSLLTSAGFDVATANYGLTAFNLGGVVGAVLGAIVFARFGSRITMLAMTAGAIAGSVLLASAPIGGQSTLAVLAMLAWTGGLINAVQTTMYALAAHVYPAGIRATGVGTSLAVGRIGGVASTYAGAWALESGPSQMFALIAGTLSVVFVALASVRNHIPRHERANLRSTRSTSARTAPT
ncbi:MAG TPA: MFS transporter [Vicinamibacterales bacterium]|jgi:AAHS family 4-hydroxybenzoate transporter-like MFS transporter|nr:MFS transporter [Vicinamibacterales bacterium]